MLITVYVKRERALFRVHAYQRTSRLEPSAASPTGDTSSSFSLADEYAHLECTTTREISYVDDRRLAATNDDNITVRTAGL